MGLYDDKGVLRPLFLTLSSDSVMVTRTSNNLSRVVFNCPTARVYVPLKKRSFADSLRLFESLWQQEVFRAVNTGDDNACSAPFACEFALERKFLLRKAHSQDVAVALLLAQKHCVHKFQHLLTQYTQYVLTYVVPGAAACAPSSLLMGPQVLSAFLAAPADTTDTSDKTWDDLDDLFELPDVSDFPDAH